MSKIILKYLESNSATTADIELAPDTEVIISRGKPFVRTASFSTPQSNVHGAVFKEVKAQAINGDKIQNLQTTELKPAAVPPHDVVIMSLMNTIKYQIASNPEGAAIIETIGQRKLTELVENIARNQAQVVAMWFDIIVNGE